MKFSKVMLLSLFAIGLAVATFSCSSSGDSVTASAGQGVLSVRVHDDPSDQIDQAWITFTGVNAVAADRDRTRVAVTGSDLMGDEIDLAALINGNEEELAVGTVPAGNYDKVELIIAAVRLVLDDGTELSVPLPGASFALVVAATFEVVEGDETVLRVDIPLTSFTVGPNGNWQINAGSASAR